MLHHEGNVYYKMRVDGSVYLVHVWTWFLFFVCLFVCLFQAFAKSQSMTVFCMVIQVVYDITTKCFGNVTEWISLFGVSVGLGFVGVVFASVVLFTKLQSLCQDFAQ